MIFVDAREIQGKTYGVGRYLKNLLREWKDNHNCFTLILTEETDISYPYERIILPGNGKWKWEFFSLKKFLNTRKDSPYFTPGYYLPPGIQNPSAFVLHDISFIDHPEWFNPKERLKLNLLVRISIKKACYVFTVSQFSKRRIIEKLGIPEERVIIAQQGLDPEIKFDEEKGIRFREKYGINGKMLLYVGAIFQRRNIPLLLEGFSLAKKAQEMEMVIVGEDRTWPPQRLAGKIYMTPGVHYFSYLEQDELIGAYSAADLFVYLSEYEGFGMPPMEATSCNTPLLLYASEALKEIYGSGAIYLKQKDPVELSQKILSLLFNKALRERIIKLAKKRISLYSWEKAATKIKEALFELDPLCNNR